MSVEGGPWTGGVADSLTGTFTIAVSVATSRGCTLAAVVGKSPFYSDKHIWHSKTTTAARWIMGSPRSDSATPLLRELH